MGRCSTILHAALIGATLALASCTSQPIRVGTACLSNENCPVGQQCKDSLCTPIDGVDAGPVCGELKQPCCDGTCAGGLFCANDVCIRPAVTDVGRPCVVGSDCSSGLCIDLGSGDRACSAACEASSECVSGWTCQLLTGGSTGVCQCTTAEELCDGKDNDCNGIPDDGPKPTEQCERNTGAGSTCQSGSCVCPDRCEGLCTDFKTDNANCGSCGNACQEGASCHAGQCACDEGTTECDGACVNVNADNAHCGTCSLACNTGTTCVEGTCSCDDGLQLCGGACMNLMNDPMNCGDCDMLCPFGGSCVAGQCQCPAGQLACDGVCVQENIGNCGACGRACTIAHDAPVCSQGICLVRSCDSGFADCNTDAADGCEIDTRTDSNNCSTCQNRCLGGTTCLGSACVCPPGTSACNGGCADFASDSTNCGACGLACALGATCVGGGCRCPEGTSECDGRCVDTSSDATNCGACGTTCDEGGSCVAGGCTCPQGTLPCDGQCTPVSGDVTNCGGCDVTCSTNHSTPKCTEGVCGVASCAQSFDNCNGSATDGCETPLLTDRNNCGSCGNQCAAATSCVQGQCKCPGTKTLCGTACLDLTTDANNCSACGNQCPTGGVCSNSTCRCAAGAQVCNGACVGVASDVNNCGSCGNVCPSGASCVTGQCACPAGKFACHGVCVASDLTNCGVCDNTCAAANGTPACVNRACTVQSCNEGYQDCDRLPGDGCEANLTSEVANCGGCNLRCSGANVLDSACASSQCTGTCAPNHDDCNDNLQADGCESDLNSDVNNCGGCGIKCGGSNVGAVACIAGQCTGMCISGYADCDMQSGDGCEVALNTDVNNCGTCGAICSAQNVATRLCTGGLCKGTCQNGYADCNTNMLADGCEISTLTDTANCGGCNQSCSGAHVSDSTCSSGTCTGTCATGYKDCDNNLRSNGCERDIFGDTTNCGGCGVTCSGSHVVGSICSSGACAGNCAPGYKDCNNNLQLDGCEKNTAGDVNNCGGCGVTCSTNHVVGSTCGNGVCGGTCAPGYTDCNGNMQLDGCETKTSTDVANCGACGASCSTNHLTGLVCSNGSCAGACATGFTDCDGDLRTNGCETNTGSDATNCGGCGVTCSGSHVGGSACVNGTCSGSCLPGYSNCNSNLLTDGCETGTTSDLSNCGGCNAVCSTLNVDNAACTTGTCTGTCQSGTANCDGNLRTNGCETSTAANPSNCGGCGIACSGANMLGSGCSSGACIGTCKTGYTDCDGNLQVNGCEIQTAADPNNCGTCGSSCSANHVSNRSCSSGSCGGTCFTGYADCNSDKRTDGCEASLFTDPDNCGSCGRVCPSGDHMGTRTCANPGTCSGTCDNGFADCDNNKVTNGCEADLASPDTCGTCLNLCSGNHMSSRTCTTGACGGSCSTGFADCNSNKGSDGCETSIFSNTANCGACGVVCSPNHVVAASCSAAGVCNSTCSTGFADCNGNKQTDGCEISIFNNTNNCGGCGLVCSSNNIPTTSCSSAGVCNGTCGAGFADCNGSKLSDGCEINTTNNTSNCGGCGITCSTNHVNSSACTSSACTGVCATGWSNCNGNLQSDGCEVDITTTSNCGTCGTVCSSNHVNGSACSSGLCAGTCATGYANCNGNLQSDGCEINTNTNASNCGGCGIICPSSAPTCSSGTCTCPSPSLVCNGVCISQSTSNCGLCGIVCSTNHIQSATCNSGTCGGTCSTGYADCDGNKQVNGCETDITTTSNCGGCGVTCGSGQVCSSGTCTSPGGQIAFTTPGTQSWTVPAGVTSVSVVVIGAGGGGAADRGPGGGGGALAYGNNIPVTPGQSISIRVGRRGDGGWNGHVLNTGGPSNTETDSVSWDQGQPGEMSWFSSSTALYAEGGGGTSRYNSRAASGGSWFSGGNSGGIGSLDVSGSSTGGAGGGVGLYGGSSSGGGGQSVTNGAGGGAAGYSSTGGDGVTGTSNTAGAGGSSGSSGGVGNTVQGGYGGLYGGGGSAGPAGTYTGEGLTGAGGSGANGAVRIIWGPGRAFPNTLTNDQ